MKRIEEAERALFSTAEMIEETGPRLAGTSASLKAADLLSLEMETFCDSVEKNHFVLHKGAFLGWIRILVAAYFIGVVFLWLSLPLVTLILLALSLFILVTQFFQYKEVIDVFYPKKSGCNVIGTIEPTVEVSQQVIISGHHDSARIFNFFIHQPKLYNLRVTGGIALVVFLLVVSIVQLLFSVTVVNLILNVMVSLGFLLTGQMWFFASSKGTPGAGDNLIASHMAMEVGKYFKDHPLKHTRVIVASFDAEEEGLRGARAFAKSHQDLFKEAPTTLLNVDCPYKLEDMFFLTTDINGSVKLSTELAEDLVNLAEERGYFAFHQPIAFLTGGTDAAELAKYGVKATTMMAMPWSNKERASVYHTPEDTVDAIDIKAVAAGIDLFIEYIRRND